MSTENRPLHDLIHELSRLPGIGPKSAQRLTYFLLESEKEEVERLANAIVKAKDEIEECQICRNYTDINPCPICSNEWRDPSIICVVESPKDLMAMERTQKYRGHYHVLHGVIVPERGILPDKLRIKELLERLKDPRVKEIILATNPTRNGDMTALYLGRILKDLDVKVSRIAYGIPIGGDLEYYDEVTIATALDQRVDFKVD